MEENKASVISLDAPAESAPASVERNDTGARVVQFISKHEHACLATAISVFALTAIYKAFTTPLWFDEFFTLFLSHWSSIPELLKAIPADGQPPLQYILTHLSWTLLGVSEFSVRLPEILAYVAVGFLTYRIVRRHGAAVQALFATVVVMGAPANVNEAYTARPYELVLAFTALVFACWQVAASRERDRILPLCGITVGIAGAILSHHFGIIFIGLLLGAGEFTRLLRSRRVDAGMLAAIAAGSLPLAVTIPLAYRSHVLLGEPLLRSSVFRWGPTAADLLCYRQMVPLTLLYLIALVTFLRRSKRSELEFAGRAYAVPAHEWAAAGVLCLIVPVQLLLAALATNLFWYRYAIPTSLGLALIGGWGLHHLPGVRKNAQRAMSLATIGFLILVAARLALVQAYYPAWRSQPSKWAVPKLVLNAPGQCPIVVANSFDYPAEVWYSPPALKKRLIYLSDESYAVKQRDFLTAVSLDIDKAYTHLPTANYATFLEKHSRFLVLCTGSPSRYWIPSRLRASGWRLTPISRSGRNILYRADRGR